VLRAGTSVPALILSVDLREKGLTEGITITSYYEDRQGEHYENTWTINPLLLKGSGYSESKGYEDEVQALEKISKGLDEIKETMNERHDGQVS
jgi:hypothetical protein